MVLSRFAIDTVQVNVGMWRFFGAILPHQKVASQQLVYPWQEEV